MGLTTRSTTISVKELRARTGSILRKVRDTGESIDITYYGVIMARIIPATPRQPDTGTLAEIWTDMDSLAAEIGRMLPSDATAAEAVSEARR